MQQPLLNTRLINPGCSCSRLECSKVHDGSVVHERAPVLLLLLLIRVCICYTWTTRSSSLCTTAGTIKARCLPNLGLS